jgi:NNP family nitrate/nitrite transporter-like MFS transporter
MLLYGIIWVSLTLNYLTEVRQAPVMGEQTQSPAAEQSR